MTKNNNKNYKISHFTHDKFSKEFQRLLQIELDLVNNSNTEWKQDIQYLTTWVQLHYPQYTLLYNGKCKPKRMSLMLTSTLNYDIEDCVPLKDIIDELDKKD